MAVSGSTDNFVVRNEQPPRHIVVLMVNAATETDEQVDTLIEAGRQLLRDDPEFQLYWLILMSRK